MKFNLPRREVYSEIIAALFIFLFVYAAISKIQDFEKFQVELAKSPIINFISAYVSVLVPVSETLIAILLITKRFQLFAIYASFSLMVIFSCYIVVILNLSPYIPCTCGGILENMTWTQHLIFNIAFVILAIVGVLTHPVKNLSAVRG